MSAEPNHRVRWSLRVRLMLWFVVIFAVIQWSSSVVFWLYQSESIERIFDEVLARRAVNVAREIEPWLPDVPEERLRELGVGDATLFRFQRAYVNVFRSDGELLSSERALSFEVEISDIAAAMASTMPIVRESSIRIDHSDADDLVEAGRVAYVAIDADGRGRFVVALATSDAFVASKRSVLAQSLLVAGIIGPLAAAVAGWFIGGIAVAPFERLRRLASELRPDSIDRSFHSDADAREVARLTDELELARQRIVDGFAAQERFLSNVSHEIKTPIAVMLTEAQTLDASDAPERVRDFVESVGEEMRRLGSLVESFLTLTRVRDGKGVSRLVRCVANDLVMESVDHCAPMAHQRGVTLNPTLLSDDETMDAAVIGDPDLLRTLLDNLVRNAIRFSPVGESVEIRLDLVGAEIIIEVRDRGPGIPDDRISTIFDRFAQVETSRRTGRGHGLGLSIAQGIAELHGGEISVENCVDAGCVFRVNLPLDGADPDDARKFNETGIHAAQAMKKDSL